MVAGAAALALPVRGGRAQAARNVVRIGVLAPRGIGTLDPHLATAHHDRMLASWMHGALVRFRPGSASPATLEPDLAHAWEASADRRIWTFHLRPGVAFHGGAGQVTASDVVASLRKAATPASSAYAGDFAGIEAVDALNALTVRITLNRPDPALPGLLANYAGGFIVQAGAGGYAAPAGFGPFMLASHAPGHAMTLVANDAYWRGRPKLQAIEYRFVATLATSDLAFNAGELDIIEGQQDQAWINRTRQTPHAKVDVIEPAELSWLHLNITQKPLDDLRVRLAVALAVDRSALAAWRGPDLARAARGLIPASYLGFAGDVALPGHDPAQARRLLAEAGYPDGVALRTIHTQNPAMLGAIQVVQAQLRRAGIRLDVQVVDHLTYHQMIRQDLSPVVHYAAARFPAADATLTQFFHSRSIVGRPGGVTNFAHCAAADAEIDAARAEPDAERQLALWAEAQHKIAASCCAVPLIETRQVWARDVAFEYGFALQGAMATGPLLTEAAGFAAG